MRAIIRALPMLAPGKTLSFIHLPSGLDPDDLIKRDGPQAMARLLEKPQTLADALWEFEFAAAPLNTPEDKAGLRARLIAHVENVEDRDIASLYRRELLDRFYAFAFPKREFRKGTPNRGAVQPFMIARALSSEARGQLQAFISGGARDRLARAVIAGLSRFPDEIPRHADALGRLTPDNLEFAAAIDTLLEAAEMLEAGEQTPISSITDLAAPPDNVRFTFLREEIDPQAAREELSEAVALLVERPQLESALAAATARFERTFDDAAFAEQQMLLKRKLEFEARLGQMASKRAARAVAGVAGDPPGSSEQD
jgi:DNA primase